MIPFFHKHQTELVKLRENTEDTMEHRMAGLLAGNGNNEIGPDIEELMETPALLEGRARLCLFICWVFCGILEHFVFLDFPLYPKAWQANEKHEERITQSQIWDFSCSESQERCRKEK